jgi:hypothetical protein
VSSSTRTFPLIATDRNVALIFWYGSVLVVSGLASVPQITSVFTMLLISLANANANIASSKCRRWSVVEVCED